MNSRTVIRKSAKWGGTVAAVLFAVMWVGSYWWYAVYVSRVSASVSDGRLYVSQFGINIPPVARGWGLRGPGTGRDRTAVDSSPSLWRPQWKSNISGDWFVYIPLWMPVALTAAIAGAGWWADSRARRATIGACATCGYSLAGLASGSKCPECGKVATAVT